MERCFLTFVSLIESTLMKKRRSTFTFINFLKIIIKVVNLILPTLGVTKIKNLIFFRDSVSRVIEFLKTRISETFGILYAYILDKIQQALRYW